MSLLIQGLSDLLVRRQAHKEAFNFRLSCKAANSSLVPQRFQLLLRSHADDEGDADLQSLMKFLANRPYIEFLEIRAFPGSFPFVILKGNFADLVPSLRELTFSGPITTLCSHVNEKGEEADTDPKVIVPAGCTVIVKPGLEGRRVTETARTTDVVYDGSNPLPPFPLPLRHQYKDEDMERWIENMKNFTHRIENEWTKQGLRRIDRNSMNSEFLDYCDHFLLNILGIKMVEQGIKNQSFELKNKLDPTVISDWMKSCLDVLVRQASGNRIGFNLIWPPMNPKKWKSKAIKHLKQGLSYVVAALIYRYFYNLSERLSERYTKKKS